jgi:predicted amidohydrolase YtcJ
MPSTFFGGGTIWTGVNGQVTDALLVVDGVVGAVGERARELATEVDEVDLGGGFLMASFADGHAHPRPGGLEAVGPQVRQCVSVDEIVDAVRKFAAEHPDDEWIGRSTRLPVAIG